MRVGWAVGWGMGHTHVCINAVSWHYYILCGSHPRSHTRINPNACAAICMHSRTFEVAFAFARHLAQPKFNVLISAFSGGLAMALVMVLPVVKQNLKVWKPLMRRNLRFKMIATRMAGRFFPGEDVGLC